MANHIYDEDAYYNELQLFHSDLKNIAVCTAQLEYFTLKGIPEGTVMYSHPVKKYRNKNGEEIHYQYTNEILNVGHQRHYVSKKHKYPSGDALSRQTTERPQLDPENPDDHKILCFYLKLRTQIIRQMKYYTDSAKYHSNSLNANKSKKLARIHFNDSLLQSNKDFRDSSDYYFVLAELEKHVGTEYARIIETPQDELKYCSFSNEIYSDRDERLRSKNELIVAKCANECGLNYQLEPNYPNSNRRADMLIYSGDREIYLEILGRMNDSNYKNIYLEKREIARVHKLTFAAIDMTDYPDKSGKQ